MKPPSRKSPEKLNPIVGAARASQQPPPQPRHVTVTRQEQVTTIFDPEVLRKYKEMVPDAPERVLRVFEQNSSHERETAAKALQASFCPPCSRTSGAHFSLEELSSASLAMWPGDFWSNAARPPSKQRHSAPTRFGGFFVARSELRSRVGNRKFIG